MTTVPHVAVEPAVRTDLEVSAPRPLSTTRGTAELVRLNLRLDRVRIPVWAAGVVGLVLVSAASVSTMYATPEEIEQYVSLVNLSPNMAALNSAMNGPGFGFDQPSLGVVLVNEVAVWGSLAFALMGVFGMARHTRAEEESERTEVLRSRMVGRHATLAAAALTVLGTQVVVGLVVLAGLLAMGYGVVGSAALSLAYVAAGLTFAALTAVAAQVASTARATIGLGVAGLGVAYLVRAVGDMGDGMLSWWSPIGWVHRVRPFADEAWWVLGLSAVVVAVGAATAVVLSDRRNLGSGLLRQRLGPAHAGPATVRLLGLTARLQRGSVIGWSVGLFVLGLAYGSIASDIEQMFADNPDMEQFIAMQGSSVTDAYLAYTLMLGAMMVGGFATASVLRLRSEESAGRAELILALPMSRAALVANHLLVTVVGSVIALVASGLGTGIGVGAALDDASQVLRMVGASLALLPAVLVLIGLTACCVGLVPKAALIAWAGLAVVVVIGLFGELFRLPQWVRAVSPLDHLPMMPAFPFDPVPFAVLVVLAAALVGAGMWGYRRRDVPAL